MSDENAKANANVNDDNAIFESIAAVRSFLMLDTPTRSLFAGGEQRQRRPFFSPPNSTTPTPALKPAAAKIDDIVGGRSPVGLPPSSRNSSPSALSLRTPRTPQRLPPTPEVTTALRKTVRTLETSHVDLKNQLEEEIQRRKTLEVTYKQLNEFRTKQTCQLEVITSSRDNYRNETIELKKMLEKERKQNLETVSALRSAAEAIVPVIKSQRSKENDKLKHEIETLQTKIHKKDERYASSESLVKSLTKEVETLNADLKSCRQNYESTLQTTIENHSKEMESLQVRIVSEWTEKRNKIKENEQMVLEQLEEAKNDISKLNVQHSTEKDQMESEKAEVEDSLKEAIDAQGELEQELEDITGQLTQLHERVKEAHLARKESEEELQSLITELGSVKEQLAVNRELQSEKDDLERRLRDAQNHAKESDASETQLDVHQELQSGKEELERRLRVAEDNCSTFEKELQETNMELGGLKQNLEEAEQIELQNEELVSRLRDLSEEMADTENLQENLKSIQSAMTQKDEMLHNVQLELEEANSQLASDKSATVVNLSTELQAKKRVVINLRSELESVRKDLLRTEEILKKKKDTELSNDNVLVKNLRSELQSVRKDLLKTEEMLKKKDTELSNDNKTTVLVEHLRKELEVAKAESALLEERLDSSKLSNWNSLVEVATNREQVRNLKEDLEEVMEEKVNGDHQEIIDVDDGKRDMDDEVKDSPRKRQKTRTDDDDDDSDVVVDNDADNDDDDDSDDDDDDDDIIL